MNFEISTPDSAHDSLVSLPCTAPATSPLCLQNHHHQPVGDNVELSTHRQSTYTLASPRQWEAISTLCKIDTFTVLAWLTGHKSSPVDPEWFQSRSLSSEQFAALSVLKGCPNSLIFAWLDCARRIDFQASDTYDSQRSAVASALSVSQGLPSACLNSESKSSAGSLSPSIPYAYSTTHSSCSQATSLADTSSDFLIDIGPQFSSTPNSHPHGCPLCNKDKIMRTCDGWKRHMKEHEAIYWCVYCTRFKNGKSKTYTRRVNLVKHLQDAHDISTGGPLADKWRKSIEKKYFSCGFCISIFTSMTEQLNHIDNEHFKHWQDIHHWNGDNVIRGLLLQPGVNDVWRSVFGNAYSTSQNIIWDPSVIKSLQLQLELSEDAPDALASAAVNKASWNLQNQVQADMAAFNDRADQQMQTSQDVTAPVHQRSLVPQYTLLEPGPAAICTVTEGQDMFDDEQHPGWHIPNWSHSHEPHGSRSYNAPSTPYQECDRDTDSPFQSGPINDWTLPQIEACSPWIDPLDAIDHGRISRQFNSASSVEQPPPPFPGPSDLALQPFTSVPVYPPGTHIHSTHSNDNSLLSSHTTPSAPVKVLPSSALLDVRPPSSQARKQRPRNKLREYYDAPDLDFEELERFMQEDERTRSVHRRR
ncbi:hypothetical protein N7G274_004337 [Stereocaulon virgatum]|uniref:C2H2-type domain-containing protein n=1 Tax=Stereocaulon virgatum TaxID=373712 RepID=A0ABR4AGR3_9LECA